MWKLHGEEANSLLAKMKSNAHYHMLTDDHSVLGSIFFQEEER